MSTLKTANIFIESLTDGIDFAATVSQARFESLIAHLLTDFALPIEVVLKKANLKTSDIKKVFIAFFYCNLNIVDIILIYFN